MGFFSGFRVWSLGLSVDVFGVQGKGFREFRDWSLGFEIGV